MTIVTVLIGVLVFVGVFVAASALLGRGGDLQKRVRQPIEEEGKRPSSLQDVVRRFLQLFKPLGEIIPRSPEEMSRQERRLVRAGIRRKDGPVLLYGVKLGLAIICLIIFALSGKLQANPFLYIVLPVLIGALVPDMWVTRRIMNRKERIQLAIPDALDLTVVCVEAGLGLDQSLMRIGEELRTVHPDLSGELRLLNLEVNAGKTRAQALRNLSSRTEVDDLRALVAVLIQTDRFGTSIAQSLRVFSDSLRTKRRQRAEERAAKTAIKMIPPLILFILPALFVVVLAPALITLLRQFLPSLGAR